MSRQHDQQQQPAAPKTNSESRSPTYDMNHRSGTAHSAQTYHTLNRAWATQSDTGIGVPRQRIDAKVAPAIRRWMDEGIREQPWNIVRSVAMKPLTKEKPGVGGETGSNSAIVETDE